MKQLFFCNLNIDLPYSLHPLQAGMLNQQLREITPLPHLHHPADGKLRPREVNTFSFGISELTAKLG